MDQKKIEFITVYELDIYEPDGETIAVSFESTTPFGSIHVGDVIDLTVQLNSTPSEGKLIVTKLTHDFIENSNKAIRRHRICVDTKPLR